MLGMLRRGGERIVWFKNGYFMVEVRQTPLESQWDSNYLLPSRLMVVL